MFCVPGLIFSSTVGVRSHFHVFTPELIFNRTESVGSHFSCFVLPDSFSAVPRASGPIFTICAPGLVSGCTEGVGSHFLVLLARTRFRRYEGVLSRFHDFCSRTRFRRCRGRWVPFSCFSLQDSFSAVPRASCPVFMFCAHRLIFGGTEGVASRFNVLCFRTRFR
jgi:hypothetical protein